MLTDLIALRATVEQALAEDIGSGDITSELTIPEQMLSEAVISAREDGMIAGMDIAEMVFSVVDPLVRFERKADDGSRVKADQALAAVYGRSRSLLAVERVALNFLQRLSGIATTTARYVKLVSGTGVLIVDTRKTTPGLRMLEKYAVRAGGGRNHRFGLYDGVLIKDNHIMAAGGVRTAIEAAKRGAPHTLKVEVEVSTLDELQEALEAGADAVLLDNMDLDTIRKAVEITNGRAILEASGGVTESTVRDIAMTGVNLISIGALTHSVKALDIGMDFKR